VVRQHMERHDLIELAARVEESVVELILLGPNDQWANLCPDIPVALSPDEPFLRETFVILRKNAPPCD
jgi:hypothetical protein